MIFVQFHYNFRSEFEGKSYFWFYSGCFINLWSLFKCNLYLSVNAGRAGLSGRSKIHKVPTHS